MQKLKLGGKSYAPTSEHPLTPYSKALTDLVDFVERLHHRVEEERSESAALKRLAASIRGQLAAQGSSAVKQAAQEALEVELARLGEEAAVAGQWLDGEEACVTPKRTVGDGGSVAGRKNLKV